MRSLAFPQKLQDHILFVVLLLCGALFGVILSFGGEESVIPQLAIMGVIGAVSVGYVTLRDPLIGLAITLIIAPFAAAEKTFIGLPIDTGQLMLALTFGAWVLRGISRKQLAIPKLGTTWALLGFVVVSAVSLSRGMPNLSYGIKELLKWVEMILIMWMAYELIKEKAGDDGEKRWQWAMTLLLVTALNQAIIGYFQHQIAGTGPDHLLISEGRYRAYGTFMQPNPFGGFTAINAALVLGVMLGYVPDLFNRLRHWLTSFEPYPEKYDYKTTVYLAIFSSSLLILLLGLLASWSRGAWLGFAVSILVLLLFWPKSRTLGFSVVVGGAILAVIGFNIGVQTDAISPAVADRLVGFVEEFRLEDVSGIAPNADNYSTLERLAHWQAADLMAREFPWLGVGFGNYEPAYEEYRLEFWEEPLGHAHNYYLNILAETGALGLAAYLLLWLYIVIRTIRTINRSEGMERGIALGLLGAWVVLSAHHMVDNLYVNNINIHLGVMFALMEIVSQNAKLRA